MRKQNRKVSLQWEGDPSGSPEDGKEAWIPLGPHKEDLLEDELSHARGERKLR